MLCGHHLFYCLTVLTLVRKLEPNANHLVRDIGEMFLNFPLHPAVWEHCGVNLKGIKGLELPSESFRLVWTTLWMVFRSSLENVVQHLNKVDSIAKGDSLDKNNPFHWTRLVFNLTGSKSFYPAMPWGNKLNEEVQRIAGDCTTFVEDVRATGFSV